MQKKQGGFHLHRFWPLYTQVGELHVSSIMSTVPLTQFLSNMFFSRKQNVHNAGNRFTHVVQHHNIKKRGKNNNRELALVDHECLTLKSNVNGGLELLHRDMREIPSPIFGTPCV